MKFNEERAPLEFGYGSKSKKLVICPKCFTGQHVTKSWYSSRCLGCKEWFNADNCLTDKSLCNDIKDDSTIVNPEFIKKKEQMEKAAYEWRDQQEKKGNLGTKSHEPGYAPRSR